MSSCCPPNSEKYLAATYATTGSVSVLPDGLEFYSSGNPEGNNAVILIPDIWGWNGGRTRNFADQLAEAGYFAIVPKLLVEPLEGGTDGDGFPPSFDFATRGADFAPYISQFPWEGNLKPKLASVIAYLKGSGVKKIGSVGFCWGGWVLAHVLDDYAADVTVGVIPHPSITLENVLFGKDPVELVSKVQRPILFIPAGNDLDTYRPGGDIYEAVLARNPGTETLPTEFADVVHGFSVRGDVSIPNVKEKVELALQHVYRFLALHL